MPTYETNPASQIQTCSKSIKTLFKSFLVILEDLNIEHKIEFGKLKEKLPKKYRDIIDQADYFNEEKKQYLRKKVLDIGNEVIREVNEELSKNNVEFKF